MSVAITRPWLGVYEPGQPAGIDCEFDDALSMFRAAARRAPDAPLIRYFDATLSCADVDRLSDELACGLLALGFQRGDRLAVYLQNVPQFLIAMLATWKAGGIMVSINPMNRERELDLLLRDSGAVALVCLDELYLRVAHGVAADAGVRIAVTTSALDFLDGEPPAVLSGVSRHKRDGTHDLLDLCERHRGEQPPPVELGPHDVAFLTYTSGTTGPPKGAMNTHRNVVFTAQAYRDWIHLTPEDVVLGIAPLFHITGLIGHVAIAFLLPAPLVLSYRFDTSTMLDMIERHRATFTIGAITAFVALMHDASADRRDMSSLRKVYSGGQPVPAATLDAYERWCGTRIHIAYGLTETTSPSHFVPLGARPPLDDTSGTVAVGVPIYDTTCRVLDENGNELPPGEVGEIAIAGPQVVPGYWQKQAETEHAFPGGELRTGDVGFMDRQGWFYVVDRKKDMIIASGYKVWPREVEDVLYMHPAIREAAVIGVPDEYRGETVRAYVSLKRDAQVTPDELIAFCRERMAAYKYPRQVVVIDELPKTVTGKILRRELRALRSE